MFKFQVTFTNKHNELLVEDVYADSEDAARMEIEDESGNNVVSIKRA